MRTIFGALALAVTLAAMSLGSSPASADSAALEMRSTQGLSGGGQAQQPAADQTASTPTAKPRRASRKAVQH